MINNSTYYASHPDLYNFAVSILMKKSSIMRLPFKAMTHVTPWHQLSNDDNDVVYAKFYIQMETNTASRSKPFPMYTGASFVESVEIRTQDAFAN